LLYELPESPSADNVAAISADYREFEEQMEKAWEKFAYDWAAVLKKKH
jgi:hypothetical protein